MSRPNTGYDLDSDSTGNHDGGPEKWVKAQSDKSLPSKCNMNSDACEYSMIPNACGYSFKHQFKRSDC